MEAIGIFHHKFSAPYDSESGANLIAKFGLYLIKNHRKLAVRLDVFAYDVGDDFFMRGAIAEFAVMSVFESQKFFAIKIPSFAFLP
jgi:hypothetical protein